MIVFAIGGTSSLARIILDDLSKKYTIYTTYNSQQPPKKLLKKNVNFFKLNIGDPNKKNLIKTIIKKNSLEKKKIILLNFSVYKKNELFINENENNINYNLDINIKFHVELVKIFLPIMIKKKYGRIIHFSSSKAIYGEVGTCLYSATKTFLNGFSSSIAKEYGKFNVTSNILSLGYFKSKLWNKIPSKIQNERIKDVPSKKLGSIKNISNTIELLINSDYINRSTIKIDGGI